jgi:plasmid stabilization system protein ParE
MAELEQRATALARGQGVFKDMSPLLPGLRVAACGSHFIFCLPRPDAPALVLAILHERMDIMARLKSRLGD